MRNILCLGIIIITTIITSSASQPYLHRVKRVIGGEQSDVNEWPWLASLEGRIPMKPLFFIIPRYKKFTCGASVLNDRWLLTAAHCFGTKGLNPRYWKAILGTRRRRSSAASWALHIAGRIFNREDWLRYRIRLDRIIVHPDYQKDQSWLNDIALIRLSKPVPSGEEVPRIRQVSLPQQDNTTFPPDGYECHMAGWGCNEAGGSAAEVAHDIILPKIRDINCGAMYAISTETRLCAGHNWGDAGICAGDSGGPLSCYDGEKWVQVGIASFTSAHRPEKFPGAFTRVAKYTDWILQTMRENQG